MQRSILHQAFFPYPPSEVWKYLTDSRLLGQWLMANDFQPVPGHRFQFKAKARINVGFDGNIYGEVLEVQPPKRLSYAWRGGPGKGRITLDSIVTWTLVEKDGGTELSLEHAGFQGLRNYLAYLIMNKGWVRILKRWMSRMESHREDSGNDVPTEVRGAKRTEQGATSALHEFTQNTADGVRTAKD